MRKLLTVVLLLLCSLHTMAQEKSVSGKITDEKDGTPLSGVSIIVKGTSVGTTTASDGTFKLNVPASAKALVITFLDFEEVEVAIGNRTTFNVAMTSTAKSLEEVVVVAYGTQKRESITGSVSKIGAEQLENRLTTNLSQALAGAAPGIAATSGNGQPGSSAALRIRGFGSVNASSAPLYVVDGFPYGGARTKMEDNIIILDEIKSIPDVKIENRTPGKIIFLDNNQPTIVCGKGLLKIEKAHYLDNGNEVVFNKFRTRLK